MSETGRFYFKHNGKLYCVEPIDNGNRDGDWGNQIPGSNKMEKVKAKYKGAIKESESIITEENGFKNIIMLEPGQSPFDYVEKLSRKNEKK